jgi:hypothetical protein
MTCCYVHNIISTGIAEPHGAPSPWGTERRIIARSKIRRVRHND